MRRSINATLFALLVMGGIAVPVQGGSISGTYSADATLTPTGSPGIYVQNLTGNGDDTTFGSFIAQSTATANFNNPPDITLSGGMFLLTFSQGTLFGVCSGSGIANGQGTAMFTVDYVFTGGTGLFTGNTGEATLTATVTKTGLLTGTATGSYVGSLSVPEPNTLALLAPAVAVGAVVVVRGRRRDAGLRLG
jgi:hypothetical protein